MCLCIWLLHVSTYDVQPGQRHATAAALNGAVLQEHGLSSTSGKVAEFKQVPTHDKPAALILCYRAPQLLNV